MLIGLSSRCLYGEGKIYNSHFLGRSELSKQSTPNTCPTSQEHRCVSPKCHKGHSSGGMAHLERQHTQTHICSAHLHLSRWARVGLAGMQINDFLPGKVSPFSEENGKGGADWWHPSTDIPILSLSWDGLEGRGGRWWRHLSEWREHFHDLQIYLQAWKGQTGTCLQIFGIHQQTMIAYSFRRGEKRAIKAPDTDRAQVGLQRRFPRFKLCQWGHFPSMENNTISTCYVTFRCCVPRVLWRLIMFMPYSGV